LNTTFYFITGSGIGINCIYFFAPDRNFIVYQEGKFLNFPDFSEFGLDPGSLKNYFWMVRRYGKFENMDEFVSSYFYNHESLNFVTNSTQRRFTTKP